MRIKLITIIILVVVVSLEFYFLLRGPLNIREGVFQMRQALSSHDVMPQLLNFSSFGESARRKEVLYFQGNFSRSFQEKFDVGVVDETYFPYYENGEIHPPRKYDVENNYSAKDIEKMKVALKVARRYADINNALKDGYRIEDMEDFPAGMGVHAVNIDYILDDKVSVEKPEFLNYVENRETGRFQLVQMGFIAQRTVPYRLFEAKDALGHFHVGNFCLLVDNIYMRYPSNAIKDIDNNSISPGLVLGTSIFDIIEVSELVAPENSCSEGKALGPSIWMMHFAVNMYNELGMFSDYFPYIDYLSAKTVTHSFFGKKL